MPIMPDQYNKMIKDERKNFVTPFDVAYKAFIDLGCDSKPPEYFKDNASKFIKNMRTQCWTDYVPYERQFTVKMLKKLIDPNRIKNMSPEDAIIDFVSIYPQHIYELSLSNTQSRRSRAGKEFEAIIELMLIGADIPAESQGSVGKKKFANEDVGKMVDFVSPGVVQYMKNKRNTVLISAKTTLRERWQEVPEEVTRTGIREMYLATLDEGITSETRRILYEGNVIIATTKENKALNYQDDQRIVSFEELIQIAKEAERKWNGVTYTSEEISRMREYLETQVEKHKNHPYVKRYYQRRLYSLREL